MLLNRLEADIPNDHPDGVEVMTPDEMATALSLQHIQDEPRESEARRDHYFMTQFYQSQLMGE